MCPMNCNCHFCSSGQYLGPNAEVSVWSLHQSCGSVQSRFPRCTTTVSIGPHFQDTVFPIVPRNAFPFLQQCPLLFSYWRPAAEGGLGEVPIHMASCSAWVADTCLADATNFILHDVSVGKPLHSNATAPNISPVKNAELSLARLWYAPELVNLLILHPERRWVLKLFLSRVKNVLEIW